MILTPLDAWKESVPETTNNYGSRLPNYYVDVIKQFDVVHNPRYKPNKLGHGETYCNIFLWDVTKAMNCEIPHWIDATQHRTEVGKGTEMNANATFDWLSNVGFTDGGWMAISEQTARMRATAGFPTVVVWKNPGGIGHVAIVMPSPAAITKIAQAGGTNLFDANLTQGFGHITPLKFYTHD